jgi:hypothetical protein
MVSLTLRKEDEFRDDDFDLHAVKPLTQYPKSRSYGFAQRRTERPRVVDV